MRTRTLPQRTFRLLALLGLMLVQTLVLAAVQPALRDYQGRMKAMKAAVPSIIASAQQAGENMLAHPEALLTIPYWEQMSFCDELMNRAGGLAHAYPNYYWGRAITKYDVVLLTVRSWETQKDLILKRVKEYKAQGWTVTIIGSSAGKPENLGADFFIDNGAPSEKASEGRINVVVNTTLGWMWCCEYAAAMSRKGKFPAILYSMLMPGATEHNNKYQSPDGRRAVVDCPEAVPAGKLANLYLKRVEKLISDMKSRRIQQQIGRSADVIARRLAAGGTVGIAGMGHGIITEVMCDNKTPWVGFRAVFVANTAFRLHLKPGDMLVWMSYNGLNSALDDYAKEIAATKLDLVTSYAPDPTWSKKDALPELAHIDQNWKMPDAEVPIPVFPKAMAPVSGINVIMIARMLDDEVSARLAKMKDVKLAPVSPLPAELCDLNEQFYSEESVHTAPVPERKWGYVDATGATVVATTYNKAGSFTGRIAIVGKDGKFGCIDQTGKLVVPLQYDAIDIPWGLKDPAYLFVRTGSAWGVIEKTGKVVIPPKYDAIYSFTDKYIVAKKGGKANLMTFNDTTIPNTTYRDIWNSGEGFAWMNLDGKWGLMDNEGKTLVPTKYTDINNIIDGRVFVQTEGKWGCVTTTGETIVPFKYDSAWWANDGITPVRIEKKWGAIDMTGKELVPLQYDEVKGYEDGMMPVKLNGKWGFVDKTGALVIPVKYDTVSSFSKGAAFVTLGSKRSVIDKTGTEVTLPNYEYLAKAGDGFFKVVRDGKWGLIDMAGKEIVPPKYSYVLSFNQGKALVALGGTWTENAGKCALLVGSKWGVIDNTGKEIIAPKYDRITPSADGLLAVGTNIDFMLPQP